MIISIKPLLTDNMPEGYPFSVYPQLTTIWPKISSDLMQEAVNEDLPILRDSSEFDIGNIYLIVKTEDGKDEIIGTTGYFHNYDDDELHTYNQNTKEIYLRWHGIIPKERGQGYSAIVLKLLLTECINKYPFLESLVEIVPQTHYSDYISKHFSDLGFKAVGDKEKYDWSDYEWQPFKLDVIEYIKQHSHINKMKI